VKIQTLLSELTDAEAELYNGILEYSGQTLAKQAHKIITQLQEVQNPKKTMGLLVGQTVAEQLIKLRGVHRTEGRSLELRILRELLGMTEAVRIAAHKFAEPQMDPSTPFNEVMARARTAISAGPDYLLRFLKAIPVTHANEVTRYCAGHANGLRTDLHGFWSDLNMPLDLFLELVRNKNHKEYGPRLTFLTYRSRSGTYAVLHGYVTGSKKSLLQTVYRKDSTIRHIPKEFVVSVTKSAEQARTLLWVNTGLSSHIRSTHVELAQKIAESDSATDIEALARIANPG